MKIYGEIDRRLEAVVTFDQPADGENYLLVVHPNDVDEWVKEELPERLRDEHCRGVLLVKGVPAAGLSGEHIARLKTQYGARFHASACAVGTEHESTRLSGDSETRFRNFFEHARATDDLPDWSILDPRWPENLLAAYLLAKALASGAGEADVIEGRVDDWEPVWQRARREHTLLRRGDFPQVRLDRRTASEVVAQLGSHLLAVGANEG
ncbi:MAG: hypothetical protein ABW250_02415 [Pyrinomonadaceae bacterium]